MKVFLTSLLFSVPLNNKRMDWSTFACRSQPVLPPLVLYDEHSRKVDEGELSLARFVKVSFTSLGEMEKKGDFLSRCTLSLKSQKK